MALNNYVSILLFPVYCGRYSLVVNVILLYVIVTRWYITLKLVSLDKSTIKVLLNGKDQRKLD